MTPATRFVCAGCGYEAPWDEPPFACRAAKGGDGIEHVLGRVGDPIVAPPSRRPGGDESPFVRYRGRLHTHQVARAGGLDDDEYVALVERLDRAVAAVDESGRGFRVTPFSERRDLGAWVKDETGAVGGSHKARHLFGVLVHLEALRAIDRTGGRAGGRSVDGSRPLAIASCGNAALAAAVVARAARRPLLVFIPTDANVSVVARLRALGATIEVCPREPGRVGDPTYARFRQAVEEGALPFSCQGGDDGLAIEGGRTLAYEIVEQAQSAGVALDHVVVQVGGGALGSSVAQGLVECVRAGLCGRLPKLHFVQTESCHPLHLAHVALQDDLARDHGGSRDPAAVEAVLARAARHRDRYMRPWPTPPHSAAHGILDDETYDWLALCRALLATGGQTVIVDEAQLARAAAAANAERSPALRPVDETGAAGLAGLLALRERGAIAANESACVIFSGARR